MNDSPETGDVHEPTMVPESHESIDSTHETNDQSVERKRLAAVQRIARMTGSGYQQLLGDHSLLSDGGKRAGRAIGFVGCQKGSGATTVSLHASIRAAVEEQVKTLLIDANFRSPSIRKSFEIESPMGLAECLQDAAESDLAIKDSGVENLHLMTSGATRPKRRKDLGQRFSELMNRLIEEYVFVIVDLGDAGSPVTQIFQCALDEIILVGNPRKENSHRMLKVKKRLQQQNVRLRGLFLNQYSN